MKLNIKPLSGNSSRRLLAGRFNHQTLSNLALLADNSGSSCCCELHTSLYPLSVGRVVRREGSIHVAEEFVSCLLHQKGWFGHGQFLPVPGGVGWTSSCLVVELYHGLEARGLEEEFREDVLLDSSDGWEVTYLQYHHHSSLSPHWIITCHPVAFQ